MRLKTGFIFIAFFSLLLAACAQEKAPTGPSVFIGGTQGLEMSFLQDNPPAEILDKGTTPFSIIVQLKNTGEWDIPSGDDIKVSVAGISAADFGVSSLENTASVGLSGTHKDSQGNVIEGDTTDVDFSNLAYDGEAPGGLQLPLIAKTCYEYGTKASSSLCIKKDLSSSNAEVCSVNSQRLVSNSGAPVRVESIKQSRAGTDKVLYTILLKHTGSGKVFESGSGCNANVKERKENKVLIKIDTGLPTPIICNQLQDNDGNPSPGNEGAVYLSAGTKQISCLQQLESERGDFEKGVNIVLNYEYEDTLPTTLTVKPT